jgi:hypothetical protein
MMLRTCVCAVLQTYCSLFWTNKQLDGNAISCLSVSLDLFKLLPNSTHFFVSMPIFMQRSLLRTIKYFFEIPEVSYSNESVNHLIPTLSAIILMCLRPSTVQRNVGTTKSISCNHRIDSINKVQDYLQRSSSDCHTDTFSFAFHKEL